ncbi:coiled-coil domain-containing protein [Asaia platycodi]|uniref:hypothetical protein n=1 Tax=Asaia platycodi TaxID=610243 RepID=UPI0011DD7359|nr:hypothetical protein [Asaia platycodi]
MTDLPGKLTDLAHTAKGSASALAESEKARQALSDRLITERLAAQTLQAEHESTAGRVAALTEEARQLAQTLGEVKAELPDEAELAALQKALDEKRRQRSALEGASATLTLSQQDARLALSQAEQKADRAIREAEQARDTLARLVARSQTLDAQCSAHEADLAALSRTHRSEAELAGHDEKARQLLTARDKARSEAEQTRTTLTQHQQALSHAEAEAQSIARQRALLTREHEQACEAHLRHERQIETLAAQRASLDAQMPAPDALEAAKAVHMEAEARVAALTAKIETLSSERNICRQQHEEQEKSRRETTARALALRARHDALAATHQSEALPSPLIDSLIIPPGLERAIASALDATLDASLDETQDRAWAQLPALAAQPLPAPAQSLLSLIDCRPHCTAASRPSGWSILWRLALRFKASCARPMPCQRRGRALAMGRLSRSCQPAIECAEPRRASQRASCTRRRNRAGRAGSRTADGACDGAGTARALPDRSARRTTRGASPAGSNTRRETP